MLAYCGVDYEEETYEVTGEAPDWDRSQWTDKKFNLGMPFPNLPYFFDGETKLSETVAIQKYIAKKYKPSLLGSNAAALGKAEMIYPQIWQLVVAGRGPAYAPLEEGKTVDDLKSSIEEAVTPLVEQIFEAMGGSTWVAGEELTWADFGLAEQLEYFAALFEGRLELSVPACADYLNRFNELEAIKAWNDSDRCLKTRFNNVQANILNQ
jgi:glutathione S-transferase